MSGGTFARRLHQQSRLLYTHGMMEARLTMESAPTYFRSRYRKYSLDSSPHIISEMSIPRWTPPPGREPRAAVNNASPRAYEVCRTSLRDQRFAFRNRMIHTTVSAQNSRRRSSSRTFTVEGSMPLPSPTEGTAEYTILPKEYYHSLSPVLQDALVDDGFTQMVKQTIMSRYSNTKISRWASTHSLLDSYHLNIPYRSDRL